MSGFPQGMPGNPLYDPPAVLNSAEVHQIGGALVSHLTDQAKQTSWLLTTLRKQADDPDISWTDDDDAKLASVEVKEMGRLEANWRIMARFVPNPLELEFFTKIAQREDPNG